MRRTAAAAAALAALAWGCGAPRPQAESPNAPGLPAPREALELEGEPALAWRAAESAAGTWRVRWRCEPDPPTFGETGRLLVEAARADGVPAPELRADAGMPEHGHGLLRVPRVETLGPGRFAVENVYLHMPGPWRVYLDLGREGIFERLELELEVD
jgi:hypothetical protein